MSRSNQIRKYKGIIVPEAQRLFAKDGEMLTVEQVDSKLKFEAGYEYASVKVIEEHQLRELIQHSIEWIFQRWGVDLTGKDPLDEKIDFDPDRTVCKCSFKDRKMSSDLQFCLNCGLGTN
mgnify:CR=1 FL=1